MFVNDFCLETELYGCLYTCTGTIRHQIECIHSLKGKNKPHIATGTLPGHPDHILRTNQLELRWAEQVNDITRKAQIHYSTVYLRVYERKAWTDSKTLANPESHDTTTGSDRERKRDAEPRYTQSCTPPNPAPLYAQFLFN